MDNQIPTQPLNAPIDSPQHRHLGVLLVVLVILLMGVMGWYFLGLPKASDDSTSQQSPSVPELNNKTDLTAAETFLSDSEIDSQLDTTDIDDALSN